MLYIQDERPGHGDEIAGSYSDEQDIWSRVAELIPPKTRLNAIRFEEDDGNIPIEDLIDESMMQKLKRVLGTE